MLVFALGDDLVDGCPCRLHLHTAVIEPAAHFLSRLFQCAIQAGDLPITGALPRVGAIPHSFRTEDLAGTLHDTEIVLGYYMWLGLALVRVDDFRLTVRDFELPNDVRDGVDQVPF